MGNPDSPRAAAADRRALVLDGLLAAVMAAARLRPAGLVLPFDPGSPLAWAAYLLVAAHTLPIAVRRRYPLPCWPGPAHRGGVRRPGLNLVALSFSILIYVYTAAARCPRPVSLAGLAAAEAMLLVVWLVEPGLVGDGGTLVIDGLIMAAAWWLGDGARRRQEAIAAAQQRAAELEAAREELARRAVTEERLRIARELHDVVAHSMSIIAVQSGVGVTVLDSQPEEARKALAAVEATSRQALVEMRRLLGVLRADAEPRGSLAPAPGLADVEALAAEVARAGGAGRGPDRGDPGRAAGRAGAVRLPDRPGGADQRGPPRRARPPPGSRSATPPSRWRSRWSTTAAAATPGRAHGGHGIAGCASGRRCTAAAWRPAPGPAAASGSRPACPWKGGSGDQHDRRGAPAGIRVLVADDQTLVRAGFRVLVDSAPDLEVVGEAGNGAEAVDLARSARPDVVLMDIRMPVLDGLEATRRIVADELLAGVRVLVLTTFDLDEYVYEALRAGASGFLLKDTPPADLLDRHPGRWRPATPCSPRP
jgi:CheY-like chemotaxis protein